MAETEELEDCNECGHNNWEQVYEKESRSGRRKRVFECENCGATARIYDKGAEDEPKTIHSGAMR